MIPNRADSRKEKRTQSKIVIEALIRKVYVIFNNFEWLFDFDLNVRKERSGKGRNSL
jgi:hypothetical protein